MTTDFYMSEALLVVNGGTVNGVDVGALGWHGAARGVTEPIIPIALVVSCCADGCSQRVEALLVPISQAAHIVTAIVSTALRLGCFERLKAEVDQATAWEKDNH